MKRFILLCVLCFAAVSIAQTSKKITGGILLAAPAAEDTSDHKVYISPVPACTVIVYPVIRDQIKLGKRDKVRLILRWNPKDSSAYTDLWQWDYKQTESDSAVLLIKANFINK